ncbi:MAG: NAD(+)/NADH kinase [Candidatus Cloacimonadales bacterium]|nr:NAD(+)/NADH kinase [Candidatus Cloacimonadales bacterium]
MNNFGVFINPFHKDVNSVMTLLEKLYKTKKVNFFLLQKPDKKLPEFIRMADEKIVLDCILSFGGDGTFLKAMHLSLAKKAPLLGINMGKLGFLSDSSLHGLEKSIDDLMKKKYKIQKRMLLKASLKRKGAIIFSDLALNDAVIYKGETPRLANIKISSNKRFVLDTRCDGIIVASPTGSTAYSLSAGGPLLSPVMDAIIVSPLNPHILSVRPMVFPADDKLEFSILEFHFEGVLQLDGSNVAKLQTGDEIIVTSANRKVEIIKLTNKTFYQILRKKMHMGKM